MAQVRIQHTVSDFDAWKRMFDSDPVDRKGSGVRRYSIHRGSADPTRVLIDLELDSVEEAQALRTRLLALWAGLASQVLSNPEATVVDLVESGEL